MLHIHLFQSSKRHLLLAIMSLLIFVTVISPKVYAGAESSVNGTCANGTSGSIAPSPYFNGAPISKVFYPADGSTVTVTSTGAVIKQSPCQTPYREGWINPAELCNLDSFSQLSSQVKSGASNPYSNSSNSSSTSVCGPGASNTNYQPAQSTNSVENNIQNTSTSSSTSNAYVTPNNTSYVPNNYSSNCNLNTSECCNSNPSNCCNRNFNDNSSTNCNSSYPPNKTAYVPNNNSYTASSNTLPDTGPSDVLAVGGISSVLGTLGHFIYRRRIAS